MSLKKSVLALVLGCSWFTSSFAGTEDWNGAFTFQLSDGKVYAVNHAPTRVQFLFFNVGGCLHFGKGSSINGLKFKEDVDLCTNSTVDAFTNEVQKMGAIVNKEITIGSTYPG